MRPQFKAIFTKVRNHIASHPRIGSVDVAHLVAEAEIEGVVSPALDAVRNQLVARVRQFEAAAVQPLVDAIEKPTPSSIEGAPGELAATETADDIADDRLGLRRKEAPLTVKHAKKKNHQPAPDGPTVEPSADTEI